MLSAVDPRKRPQQGAALVRAQVTQPRGAPAPVWRLSDPGALSRLTRQASREEPAPVTRRSSSMPTPVPWLRDASRITREAPELYSSIPVEIELMDDQDQDPTRQLPAVIAPAAPRSDARARFEAVPDMNLLVSSEVEARARMQREVEAALLQAVQRLQPDLAKKSTSPMAWLLLGLSLGGLLCFFMMSTANARASSAVPPTTVVAAPPPTSAQASTPAPVCVAPEIAPQTTLALTTPIPSIPTFDVNALPKHPVKTIWVAPRRAASAPAAPKTTDDVTSDSAATEADSDNPYDDETGG